MATDAHNQTLRGVRVIQQMRPVHEAMVDWILAHPEATQVELARQFKRSPQWVCRIIASPVVQERLAARRAVVTARADEQLLAVLLRSLEVVGKKLDRPAEQIPDQLALRALDISSRVLAGRSSEVPREAPTNWEERLSEMADRLVKLLPQKSKPQQVIDAELSEPDNAGL